MCVRERRDEDGLEVEDVVMIPERERRERVEYNLTMKIEEG